MNTENTNVSQKDIENAKKVPVWLQYAFIKASEAIKFNCAWGFITGSDLEEFNKDYKQDFKDNQGKLVITSKVSNGYVFELPFAMMNKIFRTVIPDMPEAQIKKYLEENQKIYNQDKIDCGKYLDRILTGKVEPSKTSQGYKVYDFGLYCVNQSYAIKDENTTYKAYKMSIETFKKILASKGVQNKFFVSDGKSLPVPFTSADLGKMLKIADSKNGVVFKLCYKA